MADRNDRRHSRIKHSASIKVVADSDKHYVLEMKDFSDSGLFLFFDADDADADAIIEEGDILEVQTLEMEDAPVNSAKVTRIMANIGFAVEFLDEV